MVVSAGMFRKEIGVFTLFSMFVVVFLAGFMPAVVIAQSVFDGTYDYSYNLHGPNGWETHTVESGFIVSNGHISSNPSALSGTVSSGGSAYFVGPCPYGDPQATFTGTISSDGTGDGTYSCPYNHVGSWSVTRVSGGGSSSAIGGIFGFFAGLGAVWGVSDDEFANATLGMMMLIVPFVIVVSAASHASRKNKAKLQLAMKNQGAKQPTLSQKRELGYQASQPDVPPQVSPQALPQPITADGSGHLLEASGQVIVTAPSLPSNLNLRANWMGGQVQLSWDEPQIDASQYQLDGYVVSAMQYGPNSTAPIKTPVAQLQPGNTNWSSPFNQTYQWNTNGDLEGYTVEALVRHTSSTGSTETLRIGAMTYAPHPPLP